VPYYPIFLNLAGRRIVVIGGGNVAEGKVSGLLAGGADDLTVVSPDLTPALEQQLHAGNFTWRQASYAPGDLEGFDLCFIATDDGIVNREVAEEARRRRILVNAADDPANCDFILPSVVRRGPVVVAASTGGSSPALARRLREDLSEFIGEDYGVLAALLAEVRQELRRRELRVGPETWSQAIDDSLREHVRTGRLDAARQHLVERLGMSEALSEPAR
jgi:siroheme synthase-like protein